MAGMTVELGFLGTVIHVEMPEAIETQQSMSAIPPARLNETDIQVMVSFNKSQLMLTRPVDSGVNMPFRASNIGIF